jgi:hypothetical protein
MDYLHRADSGFADLLMATVSSEEGQVTMLRAYLDASEMGGVYCVAGVAFGYDRAIKAERKWRELYQDRYGHMTDLHARQGEFNGISREEADRLCRGSVSIINEYASQIVVVSCDVAQVESHLPQTAHPENRWAIDAYKGVYPCCLNWLMGAFGEAAGGQKISYWIEAGDEFSGAAGRFLQEISQPFAKDLQTAYALGNFAFLPSHEARLFEAADLVAWEWATHMKRLNKGDRRVRGSLPALMGNPVSMADVRLVKGRGRYAMHYAGEPIEKHMKAMQRLMDASSVDEMIALRGEWQERRPS